MAYSTEYTGGITNGVAAVSMTVDYALKAAEKKQNITITCSAASKTVTLGLADGETCFITNVGGTNAITVKNVAGDTGTSLAAGKVAYVIASTTADSSVVKVLN